jgi:hypothetical protein
MDEFRAKLEAMVGNCDGPCSIKFDRETPREIDGALHMDWYCEHCERSWVTIHGTRIQ